MKPSAADVERAKTLAQWCKDNWWCDNPDAHFAAEFAAVRAEGEAVGYARAVAEAATIADSWNWPTSSKKIRSLLTPQPAPAPGAMCTSLHRGTCDDLFCPRHSETVRARHGEPKPAPEATCTGYLVHSEFSFCPVCDSK